MKLVDYFNDTVTKNISEVGGWGPIYYGVFSKVINENNYKTVAEVGIGYGTHALYTLITTKVEKLYLIDPTKMYPDDDFARDIMAQEAEVPGNNFNELHDLIRQQLVPWRNRYTWFRTESLSITNDEIPDGTLDCVFVDGDHSFPGVSADLEFWWKKVRVGGQMLGDDYWLNSVERAVKDFSERNNIEFDLLSRDDNPTYKIFRFKKG